MSARSMASSVFSEPPPSTPPPARSTASSVFSEPPTSSPSPAAADFSVRRMASSVFDGAELAPVACDTAARPAGAKRGPRPGNSSVCLGDPGAGSPFPKQAHQPRPRQARDASGAFLEATGQPQPRSKRAVDRAPAARPSSTQEAMRSSISLGDKRPATAKKAELAISSMGRAVDTNRMDSNERHSHQLKSSIVLGGNTPRVRPATAAPTPMVEPRSSGAQDQWAQQQTTIECLSPTHRPKPEPKPPPPKPPTPPPRRVRSRSGKSRPMPQEAEPEPEPPKDPRKRTEKADPNPSTTAGMLRSTVCLGDHEINQELPPPPEILEEPVQEEGPKDFGKKRDVIPPPEPGPATDSKIDLSLPEDLFVGADVELRVTKTEWKAGADQWKAPTQAEGRVIKQKSIQSNPFNLPPDQKPLRIAAIKSPAAQNKSFPWKNSARREAPPRGSSTATAGSIIGPVVDAKDYKLVRPEDPAPKTSPSPPPSIQAGPPSPDKCRLNEMKGSGVI